MEKSATEAPDQAAGRAFLPRATRYEPFQNDSYLTWKDERPSDAPLEVHAEGPAEPVPSPHFALLLDISQTGAAIAMDRVPQQGEDVWLKVGTEGRDRWNQAEVVGVTTTPHGPHLVRLAFNAPCSDDTLVKVVCG